MSKTQCRVYKDQQINVVKFETLGLEVKDEYASDEDKNRFYGLVNVSYQAESRHDLGFLISRFWLAGTQQDSETIFFESGHTSWKLVLTPNLEGLHMVFEQLYNDHPLSLQKQLSKKECADIIAELLVKISTPK